MAKMKLDAAYRHLGSVYGPSYGQSVEVPNDLAAILKNNGLTVDDEDVPDVDAPPPATAFATTEVVDDGKRSKR